MRSWLILLLAFPAAASAKSPTFESDILPILNARCLHCHGRVHQHNDLDLRTLSPSRRP